MQRQTQTNDRNTKSVGYFLQVRKEKHHESHLWSTPSNVLLSKDIMKP